MSQILSPETASSLTSLSGLSDIAHQYDVLLCDIWGVIHNGVSLFPETIQCLETWQKQCGIVLLLTNAPRPSQFVQERLDSLGLPRTAYHSILSSGDVAYHMLSERAEQKQICHFVGSTADKYIFNNIDITYDSATVADFIFITGLRNDTHETLEDYKSEIEIWCQHQLPLICANPDKTVHIGDRQVYCAGAIAELYENSGGEVIWIGKPYPPIYNLARQRILDITDTQENRILAIGDGIETDILGANQEELDVVFVTSGLMSHLEKTTHTHTQIVALLQQCNVYANYHLKQLSW